jgi:hypothetical protein
MIQILIDIAAKSQATVIVFTGTDLHPTAAITNPLKLGSCGVILILRLWMGRTTRLMGLESINCFILLHKN